MKIDGNSFSPLPTKGPQRGRSAEPPQGKKEDGNSQIRDRVEITGQESPRSTTNISQLRKNPYEHVKQQDSSIAGKESELANSSLSEQRLAEIQERVENGYYDSDEVQATVRGFIFEEIQKG